MSKRKPFPPFFLIEGHNRLEHLLALARFGEVLPEHEVWVATSV
jgi:hypothetical protein